MNLSQLKISTRLALGYGLVVALLVMVVATACLRLQHLSRESTLLMELQADLDKQIDSDKGKALLAAIGAQRQVYVDGRKVVMSLLKNSESDKAQGLLDSSMLPASKAYIDAIEALARFQQQRVTDESDALTSAAQRGTWTVLGLGPAASLMAALAAWVITRSVLVPLRAGIAVSERIASGDLGLSGRTEQTASNLQQAAGSARTASQLATSAADVAQRGGRVMSEVVSTMNEINASSKKIADIIGTTDGIAFQTNILALNAAVEAARAGEQSTGISQVNGAGAALDNMTQQTAALVEESTAAAERLREQAAHLSSVVGVFKLQAA